MIYLSHFLETLRLISPLECLPEAGVTLLQSEHSPSAAEIAFVSLLSFKVLALSEKHLARGWRGA